MLTLKMTKQMEFAAVAASLGLMIALPTQAAAANQVCHPVHCPSNSAAKPARHVVRHAVRRAAPTASAVAATQPAALPDLVPPPPVATQPAPPVVTTLSPGMAGLADLAALGLEAKRFDAGKPFDLPMVQISDAELKRVYDKSGCNLGGPLDALTHPINAKCRYLADVRSATAVGILGVKAEADTKDNKTVFIVTNPVVYNEQESVRGDRGEGWGHLFLQAASVVLQGEAVQIAKDTYNLTKNLNGQIINNLKGGNFNLFGQLICGTTSIGGVSTGPGSSPTSVTGGATSICNIGSTLVDVAEGAQNGLYYTPTAPVDITAIYGRIGGPAVN